MMCEVLKEHVPAHVASITPEQEPIFRSFLSFVEGCYWFDKIFKKSPTRTHTQDQFSS